MQSNHDRALRSEAPPRSMPCLPRRLRKRLQAVLNRAWPISRCLLRRWTSPNNLSAILRQLRTRWGARSPCGESADRSRRLQPGPPAARSGCAVHPTHGGGGACNGCGGKRVPIYGTLWA